MADHGRSKNHVAGGLTAVTGAVAASQGLAYGVGSVSEMGPGFFPFGLGCLLIVLGGLIAANREAGIEEVHAAVPPLDYRGGGCIVGGMVLFLVIVRYGGLIPAAFATSFVAALGDRTVTLFSATLLGIVAIGIGYLLFHVVLKLPLPLFGWG